ncbi:MAG: hypothetical protein R2730_08865 [Chitinophagales bacterium]
MVKVIKKQLKKITPLRLFYYYILNAKRRIAVTFDQIRAKHWGHQKYNKFIILSTARTGTNYIKSLLNAHENTIAFGEIFRNKKQIGWDFPGYNPKKHFNTFIDSPIKFITKHLFIKYPKEVKAVGFKIFYHHAGDILNNGSVWEFLKNDPSIKIIHIHRQNSLATHLSLRKAFKFDNWKNTEGEKKEIIKIDLDYNDCLKAFNDIDHWAEYANNYFKDHKILNILYEDFSNPTLEVPIDQQLFKFLDLEPTKVASKTFKQGTGKLNEQIINYYELKEKFKHTKFSQFFID